MSNEPETIDDMDLTVGLTFYNGGNGKLQQVVHGMDPVILIKPSYNEGADTPARIDIDVTGPTSVKELADLLFSLAEVVREGEVTSDSRNTNDLEG